MSQDNANNYVPKDYADLYQYYFVGDGRGNSLVCKLIRSMMSHATEEEKEILMQDIFLRIMDKDQLRVFDPTKANFGGVIFYVSRSIIVNHLDRKGRNPLTGLCAGSLRETDPEDGEFEPGVYSLDRLFGSVEPDRAAAYDAEKLISGLQNWARGLYEKPAHKRDASLFPLIGMLAEGYDPKECGQKLGVTPSTISNWMGIIRQKAKELQASPA